MFSNYTSLDLSKFMEVFSLEFGFEERYSRFNVNMVGSGFLDFSNKDYNLKLTFQNGSELGEFIRFFLHGDKSLPEVGLIIKSKIIVDGHSTIIKIDDLLEEL